MSLLIGKFLLLLDKNELDFHEHRISCVNATNKFVHVHVD